MVTEKIIKKKGNFKAAAISAFLALAILAMAPIQGAAAGKAMTVAEIALYKGSDRQQILEEGAKKEGKLVFYTVQIVNQMVRPLVDAFQKKYPYIQVEFWRASTKAIVPRVFEEYSSNRHLVDVVTLTDAGELLMEEKGVLQPFYSPNLAYIEEGAVKEAQGGAYAAGHYINSRGLGYNTRLITKEKLPKTYQDLLDPKWKGKLAIAGSDTGVNWMGTLLEHYGEDFVRRLAKQNFAVHMMSASALLQLVAAGEYPFSPTISDSHAVDSKKKGAPVEWVALEPAHSNLGQIVLPKHAAHPHAALLYIDFDLSREAGELYKAAGYNSPRKDVVSLMHPFKRYYGPSSSGQFMKWTRLFDELFIKK